MFKQTGADVRVTEGVTLTDAALLGDKLGDTLGNAEKLTDAEAVRLGEGVTDKPDVGVTEGVGDVEPDTAHEGDADADTDHVAAALADGDALGDTEVESVCATVDLVLVLTLALRDGVR